MGYLRGKKENLLNARDDDDFLFIFSNKFFTGLSPINLRNQICVEILK